MEGFKQECKLCGNVIRDENFNVIEDVIKTIFEILLLKSTLDNDTQSVICTTCSSKLLAALNFKSKCLYTDSIIIPYVDFENQKLVDLKDIYAKQEENKHGCKMLDDREICRLCLKPMKSDQKSIQEVPADNIQIYIPEINFAMTTNPAICLKCHDALRVHSTFIKNGLDTEEKRNTDSTDVGDLLLTNPSIKMEEIEIKSEETDETLYEDLCNSIKEENEEGDSSLHVSDGLSKECIYKTTDDYNNRKSNFFTMGKCQCHRCMFNTRHRASFIKHLIIHKDPSPVQIYGCNECDYKSIGKADLKQHQLGHKDPSEVRVYKCDECDYKSIKKAHLKKHQLRHKDPSQVPMYRCDKCKFITKYKESLFKHDLHHRDPSEVRMFKCDECDYKSIRKANLQRHQLRHKNPSEVQMFECDECDYKSIHKFALKNHRLTHRDPSEVRVFNCDECDYKSIRKGDLLKHQLRHKDPNLTIKAPRKEISITIS